jgi:hypothetical protein
MNLFLNPEICIIVPFDNLIEQIHLPYINKSVIIKCRSLKVNDLTEKILCRN